MSEIAVRARPGLVCKGCDKAQTRHFLLQGTFFCADAEGGVGLESPGFSKHAAPAAGRVSQSFSGDEIRFLDDVVAMLLRCGNTRVLSRRKELQGVAQKVRKMRERSKGGS